MISYRTEFCQIDLYEKYVIVTADENVILDLEKATVIRSKLREHYGNNDFVMITHRKFKLKVINEVYEHGQLKNMKGLAIVSKEKTERDSAMIEQNLFNKSFAFFEDIEDARSWAENYF